MASYALVENAGGSQRRVLMLVEGEDDANHIASELVVRGHLISVQEHIEHGPAWAASPPPWAGVLHVG